MSCTSHLLGQHIIAPSHDYLPLGVTTPASRATPGRLETSRWHAAADAIIATTGASRRASSRQRRRPRYLLYLTLTMLSPSLSPSLSPWDPHGVRSRLHEQRLEPSSCCAALLALLPARASNELEGCGPAAAAPRGRQWREIDSAVARARRETREGTAGRGRHQGPKRPSCCRGGERHPDKAQGLRKTRRQRPGERAGEEEGGGSVLARRCSCCCCFDPRSTGRARSALGAAARQQSHQPEGDGGRVRRALLGAGG